MSFVDLFGEGDTLDTIQMSLRGLVMFFLALFLIRISGRRSFGINAAFDNIIVILLGAILGRVVVGASPFLPTISACLVISLLHRLFAWMALYSSLVCQLFKGSKYLLYKNGVFYKHNLARSLVSEDDIMEEVRLRALVDSLDDIDAIYMECNGRISTVKKMKTVL